MFILIFFLDDTLPSNGVPYEIMSGFIFSTDQSAMSLPYLKVSKQNTGQELLSDSLISLIAYDWTVKEE